MSSKKDMRRADLIIPYQLPKPKESTDLSSTMSSTLPMAAMFMRNKYMGWSSLVFAIQQYLGESEETRNSSSQSAIYTVLMALLALAVTYMPIFLPQTARPGAASGTQPPAPLP